MWALETNATGCRAREVAWATLAKSALTTQTLLVNAPQTHYARSGEYSIAYQLFGEGELTLLYVPAFVTHVEMVWEEPLGGPLPTAPRIVRSRAHARQARNGSFRPRASYGAADA